MQPRQFAQETPPPFIPFGVPFFQLVARPENRPLGSGVESFGIEQRSLVVVPQQTHFARQHAVDALPRVGSVPDDIAEAVDLLDPLLLDVGQYRLERLEVPMYVADD